MYLKNYAIPVIANIAAIAAIAYILAIAAKDWGYIMAFSMKVKSHNIASFYNVAFGDNVEYSHYISIIVETYNNPIARCKRDIIKWSVNMPSIKNVIRSVFLKVLIII
jgi:hypothetical protein